MRTNLDLYIEKYGDKAVELNFIECVDELGNIISANTFEFANIEDMLNHLHQPYLKDSERFFLAGLDSSVKYIKCTEPGLLRLYDKDEAYIGEVPVKSNMFFGLSDDRWENLAIEDLMNL